MIRIEASQWTTRPRILRDGLDAGMIERGLAYAQGMTADELRETAQRMDEAEAATKAGKGRKR